MNVSFIFSYKLWMGDQDMYQDHCMDLSDVDNKLIASAPIGMEQGIGIW